MLRRICRPLGLSDKLYIYIIFFFKKKILSFALKNMADSCINRSFDFTKNLSFLSHRPGARSVKYKADPCKYKNWEANTHYTMESV